MNDGVNLFGTVGSAFWVLANIANDGSDVIEEILKIQKEIVQLAGFLVSVHTELVFLESVIFFLQNLTFKTPLSGSED